MQEVTTALMTEIQDGLDAEMTGRVRLANELYAQERHGAALQVLWEALLAARRRGLAQVQAFIYLLMGTVYRPFLRDVALKHFRSGLEVARAHGFDPGEALARRVIAALSEEA